MEKPCFWITTLPGSATCLYTKTPTRDTLDIWPALPLVLKGVALLSDTGSSNVIAAVEQSGRVCQAFLSHIAYWQFEGVLAAMQVSFPELTTIWLSSYGETPPVVPDSFLGRSIPRVRFSSLDGIQFPGLPKLLSSAGHLTYLSLSNIPHFGYISPEAMVALSNLSSLQTLPQVDHDHAGLTPFSET